MSSHRLGQRRGRQGRADFAPSSPGRQLATDERCRPARQRRHFAGPLARHLDRAVEALAAGRRWWATAEQRSCELFHHAGSGTARAATCLEGGPAGGAQQIVGLAVLWGASSLLYDVVSSPDFRIGRVSVTGNRLLTSEEVELTASASGLNVFWVRRAELGRRFSSCRRSKAPGSRWSYLIMSSSKSRSASRWRSG